MGTPWDNTHVLCMHILISMTSLLVRAGTIGIIRIPKIGKAHLNCVENMYRFDLMDDMYLAFPTEGYETGPLQFLLKLTHFGFCEIS